MQKKKNTDLFKRIFNHNESYSFFKIIFFPSLISTPRRLGLTLAKMADTAVALKHPIFVLATPAHPHPSCP